MGHLNRVSGSGHRVRQAMTEAASKGKTRAETERLGFAAFFRFTAEHPALYRIITRAIGSLDESG
jgi:hypothetical protein